MCIGSANCSVEQRRSLVNTFQLPSTFKRPSFPGAKTIFGESTPHNGRRSHSFLSFLD
jgi:hypothetical protein